MRFPNFSMFLNNAPFEATADKVAGSTACTLKIGEPHEKAFPELTLFFPADKLDQVKRIADLLNEISAPAKEREAA